MLAFPISFVLALLSPTALGSSNPVEPVVAVLVRTPDLDVAAPFRPLGRTSILAGRTEFLAVATDPDALRVTSLRVLSDAAMLDGRQGLICRSAERPDGCSHTFEGAIRGQTLTLLVGLEERQTRAQRTHAERITTLRTHWQGERLQFGDRALIERSNSRSTPHDYVTRAVHVTRLEGSGSKRRRIAVTGLEPADFAVSAKGIGALEVLSVRPPQPQVDCIVPLVWNVTSHLVVKRRSTVWADDHDGMVRQIREGLRTAARDGFDCEVLVVEYASYGRPLFGPVHLTPGKSLSEEERVENGRLLDELTRHLLQEPEADWLRVDPVPNKPVWATAFRSVYQTLNDLLRGYPANPALLLLTDGSDEFQRREPTFQEQLWPSRIEEINAAWSPERVAKLLDELDSQTSWYDPAVEEFVAGLDADDPEAASKIAALISRLDPGGLASLHPHRKDVWPTVDVLVTSSKREEGLLPMIGGRLWSLAPNSMSEQDSSRIRPDEGEIFAELTVGEALLAVELRIRESYAVEVVIPNRDQDMSLHPLEFKLTGDGIEPDFMPSYVSSPPLERKLPLYAASPFKVLRLLAAYHLREQPFDDRHYDLLRER
jgi:hypothetical protein